MTSPSACLHSTATKRRPWCPSSAAVALLRGARGRPRADVPALADALVRVARLAEAYRDRVGALDINPLLVLEEGRGVIAVDWLVELT